MWTERHVREIQAKASAGVRVGAPPAGGELKARPDADDPIAFLLKYFFSHHRMEKLQARRGRGGAPGTRSGHSARKPERRDAKGAAGPTTRVASGNGGSAGPARMPLREREPPGPRAAPKARGAGRGDRGRRASPPRAPRPRTPRAAPGRGTGRGMWLNLGRDDGLNDATTLRAALEAGAPRAS